MLGPNYFVGVLGGAVPATGIGVVQIAGDAAGDVFFTIANTPGGGEGIIGVAEVTGAGVWSGLGTPNEYLSPQADYADAFAVSTINPMVMVVGGIEQQAVMPDPNFVQISQDGGATWTGIAVPGMMGPETAIHSIAFANSTNVFDVGSDGGVWQYNIATATWTDLNTDLGDAELDSVAVNPNNLSDILASGHSIGVAQQAINANGVPTWTQVAGGNNNHLYNGAGSINGDNSTGGQVEFVPNDPVPDAYFSNSGHGQLERSIDGGRDLGCDGIAAMTNGSDNGAFALDPNNPNRIRWPWAGGIDR